MSSKKLVVSLAIVLGAGLAVGAGSCDVKEKAGKQDEQKTYSVGEPVKVGDVQWTVTNPKDLGSTIQATDGFSQPKTAQGGGKFIQVTYKVENLGKEQKTTTGADIQDSQKRQFKAITDSFSYIPQARQLNVLSNLNPNVAQEFDLIYEVPADASGFQARVGNLEAFGNKVALVNLGI